MAVNTKKITDMTEITFANLAEGDFIEVVDVSDTTDSSTGTNKKFKLLTAAGGADAGVFAYLTAEANTTVTTAATYYPVLGTFTNLPMTNFSTTAAPAIKYDGIETVYFEIDIHSALKGDANGITVSIGIKKNGTLVDSSVMLTYLKTSGEYQTLSGTTVVQLETDDTIQLVLTADSDGDVITVKNFTTTIRKFFK